MQQSITDQFGRDPFGIGDAVEIRQKGCDESPPLAGLIRPTRKDSTPSEIPFMTEPRARLMREAF
jgi:hypothetical protein